MSEFTKIYDKATEAPSGFSFDNIHRNAMIEEMLRSTAASGDGAATVGYLPQATKTGTTITGLVFKNGVILGADTRATGGTEVVDKNCEKIHYLAPNIYCCGAGTAADTEKTNDLIASQLELLRLNTGGSQSRVVTACTLLKRMLFRYQGNISAALVLGGCDVNGPHIYQIYPHGSTSKLPYTTMGSGSLAAMAVFENGWVDDMTEEEGMELVKRSILAGIFNDLGSGSNVDICVIRTDGTVSKHRNVLKPNEVQPLRDSIKRSDKLNIKSGTTFVLNSEFKPHGVVSVADVTVTEMET